MGERKVLNKYFPPDFDPSKLPRGKRVRTEDKQMKVRMMLPMSVRCNTCGNFMYKGTKFNTRMEDVRGERYLGIKIFRFYYRCTNCSAEFCMKTDPKSADYIVEGGASRNYEPWRDKEAAEQQAKTQREEEEKGNAMKALENRTLDSKREMDLLTALDEMRSLKARHEAVDADTALAALRRAAEGEHPVDLDAEDEEAVRQMLLQRAGFVRRLAESESDSQNSEGLDSQDGGLKQLEMWNASGAQSIQTDEGQQAPGAVTSQRLRVGLGPSVAAAAWDEELEQDVGEKTEPQYQPKGIVSSKKKNHEGASKIDEREGEPVTGAVHGVIAQSKREGHAVGNRGDMGGTVPASTPSFGMRSVVIKPKLKLKATMPAQGPSQPAVTRSEPIEPEKPNALLGLIGYGSGEESD